MSKDPHFDEKSCQTTIEMTVFDKMKKEGRVSKEMIANLRYSQSRSHTYNLKALCIRKLGRG